MTHSSKKLLQAQIDFIVASWHQPERLQIIRGEIAALRQWLSKTTINDWVQTDFLIERIQKTWVNPPLEDAGIVQKRQALWNQLLRAWLDADAHQQTKWGDLFSEKDVSELNDYFEATQSLRNDSIDQLLQSDVYIQLTTDVLFNGIKDFLLDESLLSKLPGASAMLKMSKWSLSKTNMDGFLEKNARSFIQTHLPKTIELSKKSLKQSFSAEQMHNISTKVWNLLKDKPLGAAHDYFTEDAVAQGIEFLDGIWCRHRKSEHFLAVTREVVEAFKAEYGHVSPTQFFDDLGGNDEILATEIDAWVGLWLEQATKADYLRQRLTVWLTPFYTSQTAAQILQCEETAPA